MTVERATRNVGWVFGGYLLRRLLRLAYIPVLARLLTTEDFGSFDLLLSFVGIFTVAAYMGLNIYLIRRLNRGEEDRERFLSTSFGMGLVSSILFSLLMLVMAPLTGYPPHVKLAMLVIGLAVIPKALTGILHSVSAAHERLGLYALLENLTPLVEAAVATALLFAGYGLVAVCAVHTLSYALYAIVFYLLIRSRIERFGLRVDFSAWRGYFRDSFQIWVFAVLSVLYIFLGKIILSAISGNEQVGYFAAGVALLEAVRMGGVALRTAVFPYMVRAWARSADELKEFHESAVRAMAAASVPAGLVGTLLAAPVLGLLFGAKYAAAIPVLQVLSWTVFPLLIEQVLVGICYAANHNTLPIVGLSIANVVRVALAIAFILWIPEAASVALAWSVLASGLVLFVVYSALIRRYIYPLDTWAPLVKVSAASLAPVALLTLLYGRVNPFVLSALIVAAYGAGVVLFRVFTGKERAIIRRMLGSFGGRAGRVAEAELESDEDAEA